MYRNIIFVIAALMLTSCSLISNTYLAAPISGTVIDSETKKPIEGVIVAVYWQLKKSAAMHMRLSGTLHVEETVTDKNGKYAFKGWGPVNTNKGYLSYNSPELLFAKSGYYYERKGNYKTQLYIGSRGATERHVDISEKTPKGILYRSQLDGQTIELKKGGYDDEYARQLNFLSHDMDRIIRYGFDCKKKTLFRLLKYLKKEIEILKQRNIRRHVGDSYNIPIVKSCMSL